MEKRIITTDVTEEDFSLEGNLRPQTLDDYIGQEKTKNTLKVYIEAAKQRHDALDAARITVVVSPIPIPLVADVVMASVGHIPSISTKVGFSLMIPLYKRSAGVFGFITDFLLSHTGMHKDRR